MANLRVGRRSGRVFRGGRQVRESLWFNALELTTTLAAASTAVLVGTLSAAALALRPFTVVRTRGNITVHSD